jgi:hypothetical protein
VCVTETCRRMSCTNNSRQCYRIVMENFRLVGSGEDKVKHENLPFSWIMRRLPPVGAQTVKISCVGVAKVSALLVTFT